MPESSAAAGVPVCVEDYRDLARARVPDDVWGYLDGAAGAELTLAANRVALDRVALRPRVLVDVSRCDTGTELLGTPLRVPIGVAPMAYHQLAHPDGEVATARAAAGAGALFVASILATRTLTDIQAAVAGPFWLQLYWLRKRDALAALIDQAPAAGVTALMLTVDTPQVGRRPRDLRSGFRLPDHIRVANVDTRAMVGLHETPPGESAIERHSRDQFDPSLSWADLAWLKARTDLPILLKGIVTGPDAQAAVAHGAAGVVVSNHGGRQLDGTVAALDALPEVAAAVSGRCPVLFDGGIRSGVDVLKALALGADTVLVGRPALWGLAAGGEAGVAGVLGLLSEELVAAMRLAGRPRLSDVDGSLVHARPLGHG